MKKYANGKYIELTPEEIAEIQRMQSEIPEPEPTAEERIAELEEAMDMLLSGVIE